MSAKSATKELFHIQNGNNEFYMTAYLNKDGTLRLEGQDFCALSASMFGDEEYEYFYFFDKENTAKLRALFPGRKLADALSDLITAPSDVKDRFIPFCKDNGIEYCYSSWVG